MKRTVVFRNNTFQVDVGLLVILLILMFTSCFALYNAFNLISEGSGPTYLFRQILWYIIGFTVMFLLTSMSNEVIFKYVKKAYTILMYCLLYLLGSSILNRVTGHTLPFAPSINGAVSWLSIPLLGSFQPSEFMKIVLIVLVSKAIRDHQDAHPHPSGADDLQLLLKILRITLPSLILIFLQPDTGVCIIIVFTILVLLICSGIRKQYIVVLLSVIVAAVVLFFYLFLFHEDFIAQFISAYRLQRIDAWLNPDEYILGSSNQLYTALLSLGSAGLTGYGLQANVIAIPEAHTDFIFAAIGQCFGLIGTTAIVLLCMGLDLYLCMMAYRMKDRMDRFIVIGVVAMLFYQQIQNLGMIVGIFPITGITLPLISYGGSSILSYFISFAIIMNLSPESHKKAIRILADRPKKAKKA